MFLREITTRYANWLAGRPPALGLGRDAEERRRIAQRYPRWARAWELAECANAAGFLALAGGRDEHAPADVAAARHFAIAGAMRVIDEAEASDNPFTPHRVLPPLLAVRQTLAEALGKRRLVRWDRGLVRLVDRMEAVDPAKSPLVNVLRAAAVQFKLFEVFSDRKRLTACEKLIKNALDLAYPSGPFPDDATYSDPSTQRPSLPMQGEILQWMLVLAKALDATEFTGAVERAATFATYLMRQDGRPFMGIFESPLWGNDASVLARFACVYAMVWDATRSDVAGVWALRLSAALAALQNGDGSISPAASGGEPSPTAPSGLTQALFLTEWLDPTTPEPGAAPPERPGIHCFPDLSLLTVHEDSFELAATLFGGYSSMLELHAGGLSISGAAPEVGRGEDALCFGIDSLRSFFRKNAELDEYRADQTTGVLRGAIRTMGNDRGAALLSHGTFQTTEARPPIDALIVYHARTVLLALRSRAPLPDGYQFTFLVNAAGPDEAFQLRADLPDQKDTPIRRAASVDVEQMVQLPVGPIRAVDASGALIEILPLRTTASRLRVEWPARTSLRARYGKDVRIVLSGHRQKEDSLLLIRPGDHPMDDATIAKARQLAETDLFVLSGEALATLVTGAM